MADTMANRRKPKPYEKPAATGSMIKTRATSSGKKLSDLRRKKPKLVPKSYASQPRSYRKPLPPVPEAPTQQPTVEGLPQVRTREQLKPDAPASRWAKARADAEKEKLGRGSQGKASAAGAVTGVPLAASKADPDTQMDLDSELQEISARTGAQTMKKPQDGDDKLSEYARSTGAMAKNRSMSRGFTNRQKGGARPTNFRPTKGGKFEVFDVKSGAVLGTFDKKGMAKKQAYEHGQAIIDKRKAAYDAKQGKGKKGGMRLLMRGPDGVPIEVAGGSLKKTKSGGLTFVPSGDGAEGVKGPQAGMTTQQVFKDIFSNPENKPADRIDAAQSFAKSAGSAWDAKTDQPFIQMNNELEAIYKLRQAIAAKTTSTPSEIAKYEGMAEEIRGRIDEYIKSKVGASPSETGTEQGQPEPGRTGYGSMVGPHSEVGNQSARSFSQPVDGPPSAGTSLFRDVQSDRMDFATPPVIEPGTNPEGAKMALRKAVSDAQVAGKTIQGVPPRTAIQYSVARNTYRYQDPATGNWMIGVMDPQTMKFVVFDSITKEDAEQNAFGTVQPKMSLYGQ